MFHVKRGRGRSVRRVLGGARGRETDDARAGCRFAASKDSTQSWAAKLRPESQNLLWRRRATSHDRDLSQEDQEDGRRELGVRAAAAGLVGVARRMARRAIKPSDLLPFL